MIRRIVEETMSAGYNFEDFKWLGGMDGFGVPTDVRYGPTYIGTIKSKPTGYEIIYVDTPQGLIPIGPNVKQNMFKSKMAAAERLHITWKTIRKEGIFE